MYVRTAIGIWPQRLLGSALVVGCALIVALGTAPKAAALEPCGKAGYSYAGFQSASRGFGVRATLVALANPEVRSGHVAAWVGVGGAGLGPNGSDQWLQVGLSAFHGTGSNLYYEVATGGAQPQYHEIDATVSSGERQRVAVLDSQRGPTGGGSGSTTSLSRSRSILPAAAGATSRSRPQRPGTAARPSATASHTGSPASQSPRHVVAAGTASCRHIASRIAAIE